MKADRMSSVGGTAEPIESVPAGGAVVVVGAGMAGASAVESLRREGFAGRIVLVGDEPLLPYERPPLSKTVLIGATPPEHTILRDAAFYADNRIELRLNTRAAALDIPARSIQLADGATLRFDALVIATGSRVRHLAVPGADLPGVRYLRTLEEARALAHDLRTLADRGAPGEERDPRAPSTPGDPVAHDENPARVAVVGGGFIGAEVAAACRSLGIAVTVVELLPTLMAQALGEPIGAVFTEMHRAHGADLRLRDGVAALRGRDRVEELVTTSGAVIPCDLVVVGVGVRPADDWLRGSGLALRDGVLVDAYCQTTATGVFAAGDVARWPYGPESERIRVEHFDNALRQGEAAARNLLGQMRPYTAVPYFWSDQYDLKLQYVGHAHTWDDVLTRGTPGEHHFAAFYRQAGRVAAALAVNHPRDLATLKRLVAASNAGAKPDPAALADETIPLKSLLA